MYNITVVASVWMRGKLMNANSSRAVGIIFYYFIICLYLYGTLAIDLVVITKSLVTVTWYVDINNNRSEMFLFVVIKIAWQ